MVLDEAQHEENIALWDNNERILYPIQSRNESIRVVLGCV